MLVRDEIFVTHGTDTMNITMQKIAKRNLAKVIMLTGAMIPYSMADGDIIYGQHL